MSEINHQYFIPALISFTLFPSTVFWSSGILKESVAVFCLCILISVFLHYFLYKKIKPVELFICIFLIWVYWNIKYYLCAVLIITIVSVALTDIILNKYQWKKRLLLLCSINVLLFIIGSFIHPNFSLHKIISVLHDNHIKIIAISNQRNLVPFIHLKIPFYSFLINIPVSLFAGLFMPLPFQGNGLIAIAPGIINLFVLFATMALIYKKIILIGGRLRLLVYGLLLYISILAIVLTYSTPNYGTLERYKSGYLPLFIFIILAGLWPLIGREGKLMKIN